MNALLKLLFRELTSDAMSAEPRYPVRQVPRTYPVVKPKAQVLVYWGANETYPELKARWLERGYEIRCSRAGQLQLVEINWAKKK